jgi:hypothetical protein
LEVLAWATRHRNLLPLASEPNWATQSRCEQDRAPKRATARRKNANVLMTPVERREQTI